MSVLRVQPLGDHQIYRFCAKKFDVSPGGVKMGIVRYNLSGLNHG